MTESGIDQFAKTVLQRDGGSPPKVCHDGREVRHGMVQVSRPSGTHERCEVITVHTTCPKGFSQRVDEVDEAGLLPGSDVVHGPWRVAPRASSEVNEKACNVIDVNEIPRLRTASKQGWRFSGAHLVHEDGNDAGVGPLAALAWAVDVEEAQRNGFPSLLAAVFDGLLVGPFAVSVG